MNENPQAENNETPDTRKVPVDPETLRQLIKSTVSKMGPEVSKEKKMEHAKLLMKIFEKGMTPKEAMGITNQEISMIYSYAYHMFSSGKYLEALELFKMLVLLEPQYSQFATALGVCYHKLKDFENALRSYMLSVALAPNDPVPFFYSYDCYLSMNDEISAGIMLCNVINRAGYEKKYAKMKERAQMLFDTLEKQIIAKQQNAALNPLKGQIGV